MCKPQLADDVWQWLKYMAPQKWIFQLWNHGNFSKGSCHNLFIRPYFLGWGNGCIGVWVPQNSFDELWPNQSVAPLPPWVEVPALPWPSWQPMVTTMSLIPRRWGLHTLGWSFTRMSRWSFGNGGWSSRQPSVFIPPSILEECCLTVS